jgi:hypothetical protein
MHPAIYTALIDARATELRAAKRQERRAHEPRVRVAIRVAMRSRRLRAA